MTKSRVYVNKYEVKEDPSYLHPFACFSCKRSFKRSAARSVERTCPHCGSVAVAMNRKFKPPPRSDEDQWRKVEFLYKPGFRFQRVYDEQGMSVRYPATLEEARQFVRRFPPQRYGIALQARSKKATRRRG
jgi:hypothetical protein